MIRYIRAFIKALQITLSGEPLPSRSPFELWMEESLKLLAEVYKAATAQKLDISKDVILHLESRDISMETILAAVKYNMEHEYPYLLRNPTRNHLGAIYASNMNDHFRVLRLENALPDSDIKQAVKALESHLEAVPSSEK